MNEERLKDLQAALQLLEASEGVLVHMEALRNMASRWESFREQISMRQSELESNEPAFVQESLTENIANACAALNILLITGVHDPKPVVVGVVAKDIAGWFAETGRQFFENTPREMDELIVTAHVIYQHGVERLCELADSAIPLPELDDIGVAPEGFERPFYLCPQIAIARLRKVLENDVEGSRPPELISLSASHRPLTPGALVIFG